MQPVKNDLFEIQIDWIPNFNSNKPGSHFYVKFRKEGTPQWSETDQIIEDDSVHVRGLELGERYEIIVVSVDGEYLTESVPQIVTFPEKKESDTSIIHHLLRVGIFTRIFA